MIFVKFYEVVIAKSVEDYNLNLDKSDRFQKIWAKFTYKKYLRNQNQNWEVENNLSDKFDIKT